MITCAVLGAYGCGQREKAADAVAPPETPMADGAASPESGGRDVDAASSDAGHGGDGAPLTLASCAPPSALGRGRAWTRSHPMFISALAVSAGTPPAAAVSDYFDAFKATAVHLWQTGLPSEVEGWAQSGPAAMPYVSWVNASGESSVNGLLLGGAVPKPGRIGYQIGDEPLDLATLKQIETSAKAVRAADPAALVVVNFAVSIAGGDALLAYAAQVAEIDVLSMDRYTYKKAAYSDLGKLRAAARDSGKAYWRYLDAYRAKNETDTTTESDFRWDAYVGAAYGFTGHTWFVYQIDGSNPDVVPLLFDAPGYSAQKTPLFAWAAQVNKELRALGRAIVLLRSVDVRYVPAVPLLLPAGTTAWAKGAGGDPYLARVSASPSGTLRDAVLGHFRDDCEEPYVLVQNATHMGAEFPSTGDQPATFRLELDFAGASDPSLDRTSLVVLDPVTGLVGTRMLTKTGTSSAAIEVTLPAGGAVLFKYKTARPFVLQ